MARPNPIRRIMEQPLPGIAYQRRKGFRPTYDDIDYAYKIINRYVFDNQLTKPKIVQGSVRKAWGYCQWYLKEQESGSWCQIRLMDKWFCPQWFMNTLAHEMVHQYQWDIYRWDHLEWYGRNMPTGSQGHGPSFHMWRDQCEYYGINLKTSHRMKKWFKYQNFSKC